MESFNSLEPCKLPVLSSEFHLITWSSERLDCTVDLPSQDEAE